MPKLMVLQGPDKGQRFRMAEDKPVLMGRASKAVPLTDYTVSRRHAELRYAGQDWVLEDLKSANGTYLNGKRLERPTRLKDGDQIRMGGTLLVWDATKGTASEMVDALATRSTNLLDLDAGSNGTDASIIGTATSSDDSMILASPAAAEAVRSWRVISTLLDAVGAALTPAQLVQRVLDVVFEEVPADRGFILLKNEKNGEFETEAVRAEDQSQEKMRASKTIVDHVIEHHEGILCSNAMSDERFADPGGEGLKAIGLKSVICAPMTAHDIVLGVIYVDCAMSKHIYTEEQLRLVTAIGQMAGLAIEDARLVNDRMRTERLAAAGEAVAALSHYIKNILQGLKGGSDVVEMGLQSQALESVDQGWEIVRRNLDNIFSLTMDMLHFAKQREPRRSPVQLASVLKDVLKLIKHRAEDKGVLLKSDLEDVMPAIMVDEQGIHRVALNIITNAIDAAPDTSGVVNVKLNFDSDREAAVLTVGDNGPGIPEELRDRIFEAFYSTKGHGGTGLGLAVARKIVDEHQGSISVKSMANEGTLIRVRLPASQGGDVDSAATHGPSTG
ncbi:MAG: ATP-binding protein [Phycisphaerales bacterium]|nr:ATP-binding protein [Phycisphaerales bacterium]